MKLTNKQNKLKTNKARINHKWKQLNINISLSSLFRSNQRCEIIQKFLFFVRRPAKQKIKKGFVLMHQLMSLSEFCFIKKYLHFRRSGMRLLTLKN